MVVAQSKVRLGLQSRAENNNTKQTMTTEVNMFTILKAICLAIFGLALLSYFIALPDAVASAARTLAFILLAAHIIELFFFWRYVKMWQGPLIGSIALTLLFGILHWKQMQDDE